ERDADLVAHEEVPAVRAVLRARREVADERPDAVLILYVVEAAQLARHAQRQVQQSPALDRVREAEARAERRHVHEARHLRPLVLRRLAAVYAHRQRQLDALAQSPRFAFK